MKPKKFVAALVALSLVFCLVPARAFAYVDYSGDQALTQVSAVYQFLKEYGGASDLPDADDTSAAEFYANILGQTATPFYSFLYNYSYYAIFAGWRVYQASDFEDADARARYEASMDAAVDYLESEWANWLEDYPAAGGGGGSGGGSSGALPGVLYVSNLSSVSDSVTFQDGTTVSLTAAQRDGYNTLISNGYLPVLIFGKNSDSSIRTFTSRAFSVGWRTSNYVYSAKTSGVGVSLRSANLANAYGVTDSLGFRGYLITDAKTDGSLSCTQMGSDAVGSYSSYSSDWVSQTNYFNSPSGWFANTNGYYSVIDKVDSSVYSPVTLYVVTTLPVYVYGNWIEVSGPQPEGPTGPIAPDYDTPEPFQPVNPTLPNITNNITNNPSSYTGSETDYSDFLRIIIDNQKEQIQQIRDLGTLIDNEWDGFTNWLNTELDNVLGYLYNYQQFWNTLLEYQKSANGYLYSIDQQILKLRNRLSNDANMLWGLLRDIYYKIPSDGGGTLPDVTIDDGDGGGFLNWLYDLIEQAVDLLVGGSAELTGMLDDLRQLTGVFPFSLPWDLIAVLTVLQHEPVGDLTLQYPIIDGVADGGGVSWTWHELDLTFAQPLIVACNFGFFGLALLGLIHATKDMFEMVNKVVG